MQKNGKDKKKTTEKDKSSNLGHAKQNKTESNRGRNAGIKEKLISGRQGKQNSIKINRSRRSHLKDNESNATKAKQNYTKSNRKKKTDLVEETTKAKRDSLETNSREENNSVSGQPSRYLRRMSIVDYTEREY